jgi:hypothetical protein
MALFIYRHSVNYMGFLTLYYKIGFGLDESDQLEVYINILSLLKVGEAKL